MMLGLLVVACKPETPARQNNAASRTTTPPTAATQQESQQQAQQPAAQPATNETQRQPVEQQDVARAATQPAEQQAPSGHYAVLYGSFGSKLQAEDNMRVLRASRVNCYIHEDANAQYGVLVGPFRNHGEASKQMSRLQERGIANLSLYAMGN